MTDETVLDFGSVISVYFMKSEFVILNPSAFHSERSEEYFFHIITRLFASLRVTEKGFVQQDLKSRELRYEIGV